ncbi:MAG: flippase, partial [Myxococcales bacterium]|nr:flippase [Myxococcales bacterium]
AARRGLSVVIAVLVARAMTVDDFGRFGLALALSGIFEVVGNFGLTSLLTRQVATDPAQGGDSFGLVLGVKLWLGLAASAAMIGFGALMGYHDATWWAVVLAAGIVWGNTLDATGIALFDGYQRMDFAAISTLARSAVLLLSVLLVVWRHWGLPGIIGAYLFNAWFAAAFTLWLARARLPGLRLRPRWAGSLRLLRQAVPFLAIGFVWVVTFRVDMVMLESMTDEVSVGLYRSGYAFFELLLALPILTTRALYPALSAGLADSPERWRELLTAALRIFWMIALPISVGSLLVGARIVPLFYGEKYAAGGTVLALLGSFLWLWFGTMTFGWALTAADRLGVVLAGNVTSMTVNILANLALIPRLGFYGSALATVLSEVTLLAIFAVAIQRSLGGFSRHFFPWRALPAVGALALSTWLLRSANLALVIGVGAAVYVAAIVLGRALNERERDILWRLARREG